MEDIKSFLITFKGLGLMLGQVNMYFSFILQAVSPNTLSGKIDWPRDLKH